MSSVVKTPTFVFRHALVVALAGALLGLFLARFWYELDPVRFAPFGDWPATIVLAAAGSIFLAAQWWLALRLLLAPDAVLPVHAPFALLLAYILWPEVDLRLAAIVVLASMGLAVAIGLRAMAIHPRRPPSEASGGTRPMPSWLNPRTLHRLAPIALALIVFGLYARTLGMHVGRADTFEFQVVAPTLGIAHPTGYPLVVIIGKLFSLLPIGSTAFRVNLTSAVFATAAAVVVYALIARLSGRRLIAFIAALLFAVSGVVWSQAVVAEVYALNALMAGVVLKLLIGLVERRPHPLASSPDDETDVVRRGGTTSPPSPETRSIVSGEGGRGGEVPALFLALGLGISHHLTTILVLPAFALAILIARPRLPLRTTLIALGLFLLGLAMWLYIPLRWPALHGGTRMALAEFVDWITGARFGGALVPGAWSDPARWAIVTRFLLEAFGPAGAALAAVGLIGLALRQWRAALITFVTFAAYVFYGLVYFVPDVSVFLIPAYLIMAIWIGMGVAFLVELLTTQVPIPGLKSGSLTAGRAPMPGAKHPAAWEPPLLNLSLIPFLLIPIFLLSHNFPLVDQRGEGEQAEAWGRYVLSLPIPDGAAILVDSEKIAPLYYLQVTENLRPDVDVLVLGTEDEYRQQLDMRLAQGQPVYLARFLPHIPYHLRSLGPLVEVSSEIETTLPESGQSIAARFGDVIELLSASIEAGDPARVTLHWRALSETRPEYHVRLRLVDANGHTWWEDSGMRPVHGYYPTRAWATGERVADYHEVKFDPAFPPGAYTLQVGLFPPFREEGLTTDDGDAWLGIGTLTAPQVAAPPLDRTLRHIYAGQVTVTGVESLGVTQPSNDSQVRLNWARLGEIGDREVQASLSLVDAAGQVVGSNVAEPYGGSLPIQGWPSGALQTLLEFHTPDRDGAYTLRLGFVDASGTPLSAKCGWLAPPSIDCPLATLQVAGEAIGDAINFDNQVLLTNWSIDRTEMRPGETINVQLNWRGLKTWDADYTAFVHLVGPDGALHGQVDAWPAQGTLPTSTWTAGQTVSDPYAVTLQPDAPSGRYQIEVGWYLLATLRRLPVLDAAGQPIDDRVIIGEFFVP